jgi:cytoskeletal protein RodZ
VDDDEARARYDDDEAWERFMGRRRDSTRRRRRRDLGFAWALLLGTLAVGVLVGLFVGRIGGSDQEEAALTRPPPRTVTVEETVETTVEETVETTVEETVPAATATATATATPTAIQYQYRRTGLPPGTIDGVLLPP